MKSLLSQQQLHTARAAQKLALHFRLNCVLQHARLMLLCFILLLAVTAQAATVLVTGANRGLGLATAALLLKQGHSVVATSRGSIDSLKPLQHLSNPATAQRTWLRQLDVTQSDSVAQLASELLPLVGPLDAVINNAGACLVGSGVDTLRRTLNVNFYGAVNVWEACLPHLRPQGCVINVTSGDGELLCLSSSIAIELMAAESLQVMQSLAPLHSAYACDSVNYSHPVCCIYVCHLRRCALLQSVQSQLSRLTLH
jgi:NADP-dependent 3-hydroxy acid dehydrogenase YdfG